MTNEMVQRVNPRALLGVHATKIETNRFGGAFKRIVGITMAGVMGLAAFGTIVVRANDDAGVLNFMRNNVRAPAAPVYYRQAQPAYPVAYYAPRAFFPRAEQPRRAAAPAPKRQQVLVAAYAPFGAFYPSTELNNVQQPRRSANVKRVQSPSVKVALPAPLRSDIATGGRIAYCVRTCDGFFFPLSTSTGSDKGDEAACNNLCPASNTKLYIGQVGADIDDARARDNGRKYTSLAAAFSYRRSVDAACSCTADGFGVASNLPVYRDGSLRRGDLVMTNTGMKVFNGGNFPYREANFTTIGRSNQITAKMRENLRAVEQASLPGKSGVMPRAVARKKTGDELSELRTAQQSVESSSQIVRYVGPDRSSVR
ncbi:MAG: DUF2865 domain-containing protein [Beijerinckiaceae bacterium]